MLKMLSVLHVTLTDRSLGSGSSIPLITTKLYWRLQYSANSKRKSYKEEEKSRPYHCGLLTVS